MKDKGSDQDDLPLTLGAAYFAHELDAKKYFSTARPPKNQVRLFKSIDSRLLKRHGRLQAVISSAPWGIMGTGVLSLGLSGYHVLATCLCCPGVGLI